MYSWEVYQEIHNDLEQTDLGPGSEYPLPLADLPIETDDILYVSDRGYMDQMSHYKDRKAEAMVIFDKDRLNGNGNGGGSV